MVLGRSHSTDSSSMSESRQRDSAGLVACTELLLGPGSTSESSAMAMSAAASSAAVAAALSADLAAAVAGTVPSAVHSAGPSTSTGLDSGGLELSQSGDSVEGRHMPHRWMRPDVAATIRTIHNNKKATIRQHYYPEGISILSLDVSKSHSRRLQFKPCFI